MGKPANPYLQNAFNKYGPAAFVFRVLCWCEPSQLTQIEQKLIDLRRPEFNLCPLSTTVLGIKRSPDTRRRLAAARRRTNWMRGRTGAAHPMYGRQHGEITRAKMRAAQARIGNSRKGVPRSPEVRAKISAGLMGKRLSPEHKAKLSTAKRGKPWSAKRRAAAEHRRKQM